MRRETAARIGGMEVWRKNRPAMTAAVRKAGETTLERHGRVHYVRMAAKRWDAYRKAQEANGGRSNGEEEAVGRGAPCFHADGRPPASMNGNGKAMTH